MVTLLHTADTHVGYRQYHRPEREADFRDAFYQVIDAAIAEDVDAVVHAGDLFNSSRPGIDALSDALEGLKRLDRADIPFLSIVGNHDGTRDRQWLDVFASLGLAVRLGETGFSIQSKGGDCHLVCYGLDHVEPGRRDRLDYAFDPEEAKNADATVLVAHGLFEPFPNGDWDARAICRQSTVEFDAILAGDDHTNQEVVLTEFGTLLTYPGSTERTAADQREPRGYDLVRVSPAGKIEREFQELDTRPFVYVDVELSEGEGLDRVLDALNEREREAAENEASDGNGGSGESDAETGSGFADSVVVVTLTGAGERVSSGPVEEFGLAREALTVRVNDRREHSEELREYDKVAFADPERAVEERLETLGSSENGREIERIVRDTEGVPESNVTSVVETRVREWLDASIEAFERAEPADEDGPRGERESGEPVANGHTIAASAGDGEEDSPSDSIPEPAATASESRRASEATETDDSETEGVASNGTRPASDSEPSPSVTESGSGHAGTRDGADGAKADDAGSKGNESEPDDTSEHETETTSSDESETSESSDGDEADGRTTQATLWD